MLSETLDHDERLRFLGIGNDTRSTLASFGPVIAKELPSILERFYAHLMKTPETASKFPNEQIKAHARDMQARHWVDGVFSGRFDQAYMEQVKRVGKAHERVGLEPRWYIGGYAMAMTEIIDLVAKKHPLNSKKAAEIIKAVVKAVFLDMDLAISVYIDASKDTARERLETHAAHFESDVKGLVDMVAGMATELRAIAEAMSGAATTPGASGAASSTGFARRRPSREALRTATSRLPAWSPATSAACETPAPRHPRQPTIS